MKHVLKRFSCLNTIVDDQKLDTEWREHALLNHKELGLDVNLPVEKYWAKVLQLKNSGDNLLFENLEVVINLLLILPFSNASVEKPNSLRIK